MFAQSWHLTKNINVVCLRYLLRLVMAYSLFSASVAAQEIALPDDFYDPQLLAFGDWMTYAGDIQTLDLNETDTSDWRAMGAGSIAARQGETRWYRVDFTVGWHYRSRDLGLYIGTPSQAHEIYLNGRYLGGQGAFLPMPVDSAGKPSLTALPQLGMWYSFMNLTRSNTLIFGVQGLTESMSFNPEAIQIDDMDRLTLKVRTDEASRKIVQGTATSIQILIFLFCAFLFVSGLRGPSNVIFGLFVLTSAILIFVDSLIFYDFGTRYVAVERLLIFGKLLCAILFCRLVRIETNSDFEVQPYWNQAMAIVLFVTAVVTLAPVSLPTLDLVADAIAVVLIINSIWVARGVSTFQMKIMALLAAIFVATYLSQFMWPSPGHSLSIIQLSYLLITFTFLFLIAQRYQDMSRHLVALSGRLVSVRDLERARMARDMHDGLGQGIAAVGLHLKILASKDGGSRLGNLTRSIDDLNIQVVEIIENLHPSVLNNRTLGTAIERHMEGTLSDTGISYECLVDKKQELLPVLKEQLFRIYQESLNNAVKHASCSNITVEMRAIGRTLQLRIQDDGIGFNVGEKRDLGVGLSTMRERASLANGVYTLESAIGRGTKIQVEITLDD